MSKPNTLCLSVILLCASLGCKFTGNKDKPDTKAVAAATAKKPPGPPIEGDGKTIRTIIDEFDADHSAAQSKYGGREAKLVGVVSMTIGQTFRVNEDGKDQQGVRDILCRVNDAQVVGTLKVGDKVEISGTIKGTVSNQPRFNVEMTPCKVKSL